MDEQEKLPRNPGWWQDINHQINESPDIADDGTPAPGFAPPGSFSFVIAAAAGVNPPRILGSDEKNATVQFYCNLVATAEADPNFAARVQVLLSRLKGI